MTLEEFADLLRTPLPGPPELSQEQLVKLRAARGKLEALLPSLPGQLPTAPEWMLKYSRDRGLLPGQGLAPQPGMPMPEVKVPPYYGPRGPSGYGPGVM